MRKLLCLLALCCALIGLVPVGVHADSLTEYQSKSCEPGENAVIAQYTTDKPKGTHTYDESTRYHGDKRYYELGSYEHETGGEVKFCQIKVNETLNIISVIAIMVSAAFGLFFTRSQDAA